MSNITKAFQAKQGLRSASLPGYAGGFVQKLFGGGKPAPAAPVVDPRIAQIEASQRALQQSQGTYGSAPAAAAVAAPVVSAAPTQQVAPVGVSLSSAVGAIQSRGEALKAAAGYKDGEVPVHEGPGIVDGPGGPREDKVDAKLSDGEAVLPAATVAALGGPEEVAELIQRTNGKEPARGLRSGVHASTGVVGDMINPNDLRPEFRSAAQTPVIQPAANAGLEVARDGRAVAAQARTAQPQGFYEKMGRLSAAETPKPTAAPTVAKAAGLAGSALGYLGPIANGVGIGTMIAHAVDSIPSLRGRATAEASNMELAGTPQHDEEVNKALVAQDAAWEQRHGKTLTDAQRTQPSTAPAQLPVKAKTNPATGDYNSGYDAKEAARAKAAPIMVAEQNPNVLGLRASGVTGPLQGDVTENGKTGKTGIRTIETGNGKVYAGRDAKGQLIVNSGLEQGSLADIDKARDAKFAAAGYGKDSGGNWVTPERIAAKEQLRQLQYENAKFNATSDQIKDPRAQAAGLRGLAQYDIEEKLKREGAMTPYQKASLGLQREQQEITKASHAAMQGNTDRAALAASLRDAQETNAKADKLFFTTNDPKTGDEVVNNAALAKYTRWKSSFAQNDPRSKLTQAELYRRFMAEQAVKEMGGGGAKTELPINHTGQRTAGLRDVFTGGNGVVVPFGAVETFDNGAAIRSSAIPKDEYDTRRLLGLDKK